MVVFRYLLIVSELSALIVGTYYFKKVKQNFLYLFLYVVAGVFTDAFNLILIKSGMHNLWLSHIYFPLEFILMALFYMPHLAPIIKRRWMILIILMFMLYSLVNFIQSLTEYSQIRVYISILLVLFSIIYFYRVMDEGKISKMFTEPMIWVNSSVLIIYSTIFFYNILANLISKESRETALFLTNIYMSAIALFYILVAIAFWLEARQQIKRKPASLK